MRKKEELKKKKMEYRRKEGMARKETRQQQFNKRKLKLSFMFILISFQPL
jgi:hypothetical protein